MVCLALECILKTCNLLAASSAYPQILAIIVRSTPSWSQTSPWKCPVRTVEPSHWTRRAGERWAGRGCFQISVLLRRHFRKADKLSTRPAAIGTQCIEQTTMCFQFSWPLLLAVRFSKHRSYILHEVLILFLSFSFFLHHEENNVWSWHSISIASCSC